MKPEIHPDITQAYTIPSQFYTDPDIYKLTAERVFARSWQLAADSDRVRIPGQVYPFTLLEGLLDEPLLITRDYDDVLRCLSNVCTHRGALVAEDAAVCRTLRCRYHGRRFDLNGRFTYMPEFEGVCNFPTESDNLAQLPMTEWERFLFVSLTPKLTLQEILAPVIERIGWLPLNQLQPTALGTTEYLVRAHWALYCENYLEGLHIPFIHAALAETLDYGSYRTELFAHGNLQLGIAKPGEECFNPPPDSPDHGLQVGAYYYWLYPNLMLNFYPWGLSVNVVKPLGIDRTRISYFAYAWDESKRDSGAGGALDRVEREDQAVVESVQKGIRSRLYDRGRYAPIREMGTHQFHRLLAEDLAE